MSYSIFSEILQWQIFIWKALYTEIVKVSNFKNLIRSPMYYLQDTDMNSICIHFFKEIYIFDP